MLNRNLEPSLPTVARENVALAAPAAASNMFTSEHNTNALVTRACHAIFTSWRRAGLSEGEARHQAEQFRGRAVVAAACP